MIVFSGDWHLHPFKRFSTINKEGYNTRLWEQIAAITGVVDWANDHGAKYFIIPGDIFHAQGEYLNKDVIRAGYVLIDRIKAQVIMLPGNHDIFRGKTVLRHFKEVAHVLVESAVMNIEGEDWAFVPYKRKFEHFERCLNDIRGARFLVCHQMFEGTKIGPEQYDFRLKETFPIASVANFDAIVSGHCHKHQQLGNVWYPGSPYQMDFGDEGDERGFMLYDGNAFSFLGVAGPRFETAALRTQKEADTFARSRNADWHYRVTLGPGVSMDSLGPNIEIHKESKQATETRIQTENKSQQDLIKEALEIMYPDRNLEELYELALKIWKEAE